MSEDRKIFTVEQANELLPTVKRLLRKLKAAYRQAQDRFNELELIKAVGKREDGNMIMAYDHELTRRAFEHAVERTNLLIKKMTSTGVELKHIELGLVDFPSSLNGEDTLLCWQEGEDSVQYYHRREDGFAGRKPIPETLHNKEGQEK